MAETPILALAIAASGGLTLLIVARALFDVLAHPGRRKSETEG